MKNLTLLVWLVSIIGLLACNKEKIKGNYSLQIRVVNNTTTPASDVVAGDEKYGSLMPGQTSGYHNFDSLIVAPKLTFYNNETLVEYFLGVCGTPPPPYLEKGKYVYTIITDASSPQNFAFTFTKE